MSSFLQNAARIFEVAQRGDEPEDLTIRISPESGLYISTEPDYSYSSDTMFRVRVLDLSPQTTYYYTVDSMGSTGGSDGVKSSVNQFSTR